MPRLALVPLILVLATGGVDAGELVVATDRSSGLSLVETGEGWSVEGAGATTLPLPLPARFHGYRIEALEGGWIVTGTLPDAGRRELLLLRGEGEAIDVLPSPGARTGSLRDAPVPLVEDGRLVGLGWLEGDRHDRLVVRAARWAGSAWGPVEEVSPAAGAQPSAWSSRLALAAAVLEGGDWLLLWSAFDGDDDEIVWSARGSDGWTPPRRLHADNRVPDVTPTVAATERGALAAWSAFADGHYRLGLARLDPLLADGGGDWTELTPPTDRGVTDPRALRGTARLAVVYRAVEPDGTVLLELDTDGAILRRGLLPARRPEAGDAAPLQPAAIEFVYLAFGDSITEGALPFDELNLGGYPGRLGPELGCSPGVCSVDNQGVGGERTGQAVTRIESVLAASRYDVMLLMEGTNDIFRSPPISNNTIQFNLTTIADKAEAAGVEPLLASIIHFHPDGTRGTSRDPQVQDLRNRMQGVAAARGHSFADPWTPLCPSRACFNAHYFGGVPSPDPVGHPDASGFDILTTVFAGAITATPAPAAPTAVSPAGQQTNPPTAYTFDRESPPRATWYQVEIRGPGEPLFSRWYRAAGMCGEASCTAVAEIALPEGSYSWRVRGRNPAGYSPWSPQLAFTIGPPAGPTLSLLSGGCAEATADGAPPSAGALAVVAGSGFPARTEVGLIMAGTTNGFVKGGALCNGVVFEIGEPFVLPPTWVRTDDAGAFTAELSGERCFVQALAMSTCELSNLLVLPE